MNEEIESKGERRPGESMKDCVGRKIAANIREGKPRDQAVAISFSQCKLSKELDLMDDDDLETALLILNELERDPQYQPFLEGVAEDFEFAEHMKRKRKKKKTGGMYKAEHKDGGEEETPSATPKVGDTLPKKGAHNHPHETDGAHSHSDLIGTTGDHNHETQFGRHKHRDEDPIEGGHPNIGSGKHRHLMALGLQTVVLKIVAAHFPVHMWIPEFRQAWIKHPGDLDFRTTTRNDWIQHAMFSLHSAGCSIEDHLAVFTEESTRLLEIKYELKDGTVLVPGKEDWEKECQWFKDNLPDIEKLLHLYDVDNKTT